MILLFLRSFGRLLADTIFEVSSIYNALQGLGNK